MPVSPEEYLAALRAERSTLVAQGRDHESVDAEIARVTGAPVRRTTESVEAKRAAKRRSVDGC